MDQQHQLCPYQHHVRGMHSCHEDKVPIKEGVEDGNEWCMLELEVTTQLYYGM